VREVASSNLAVPTISSYAMTRTWKVTFLLALVASLALSGWLVVTRRVVPKNGTEALNRAIELQQAGRYDKAVQVLQTWMKGRSRDVSHDGFLYLQIAMIYITKAYAKPTTREQSIGDAELNLEKSLGFLNNQKAKNNGLDSMILEGVGGAYQALGDLADRNKCRFYEKARQAFVRDLPLIQGDSYTAYGSTVSLEPARAEIRKQFDSVNEKYSKFGCRANGENQPQ
jgi:tetratricopeptide (TPR) repeat protein